MTDINQKMTLRSRIREDYLTCPICFNNFTNPKALPCIHTFCLKCLADYVGGACGGVGKFPCPVCRTEVFVPQHGVQGFPDNHMVNSLSDTVEEGSPVKPAAPPLPSQDNTHQLGQGYRPVPAPRSISSGGRVSPRAKSRTPSPRPLPRGVSPTSLPQGDKQAPPRPERPKSVSPTPQNEKQQQTSENQHNDGHNNGQQNNAQPSRHHLNVGGMLSGGFSGVVGAVGSAISDISAYLPVPKTTHSHNSQAPTSPYEFVGKPMDGRNSPKDTNQQSNLYPQLSTEHSGPCTKGMLLEFGKYGPEINSFLKPFGLAVSVVDDFVISDRGGNRIFVFDSRGELKTRFNLDCTVNDVALTKDGNIVVAVSKSGSAIMRLYTMEGKQLQAIGQHFKFDQSSGIAVTPSNHIVVTNLVADNVLVFTEQKKFSVKIGWKGRGDKHFMQPQFVTSTSKDYFIVSDTGNHCLKLYNVQGQFKRSFGSHGDRHSQLDTPLGIACDSDDNVIIADSNNNRVEVFTIKGAYYTTLVQNTNEIGPDVKPINVGVTTNNNVAVLLHGMGFAQVRVYKWRGDKRVGF
ncbi:TRIM3-like protein [Mya arenaria]|uniref:TRIM3-like protein n=1 Tax=Mya arenaria TaxID=6604 RepID=A0ABY7F7K9_MYAAR|nr:tripartite motif-containing protein 2-like [Mya arenaria]WAR17950.1 TRIM3-like protein [Mya arenaria]